MPILDDTGQSPSITEGPRALRLFTDRYHLIRAFTRALHEDDALDKILFFQGGGGNGKSLLIRFLQTYACKRFHRWEELREQPDTEFVRRLQEERSFDPLPVASLDFHAPPREFEQPMVDYDALLMLRRQLGAYSAEGFTRLHFPVYDFAAVWYLHQTGRLTEERLSSLFPSEEINLVLALAQLFKDIPGAGVAQAVLGLFNKHLKEWWTLFRHRRRVDRALLEEIQAMDPERDLIPEMPHLFALDLNAALSADNAPPRIVLLFDGHDAFASASGTSAPEGDRDRWLRYLLAAVDLEGGVVPIVTSRKEPGWEEKAYYPIPTEYLDPLLVGHFSDAAAGIYLKKAGVDDPALRTRLCDYARVAPDEVHPLYAGLGADVVLQATRRGRRLTAEDFPVEPEASKKPQFLMERLLMEASQDVEYAVRSLAAARAFDRDLFEKLGSWERCRYSATDAAFDTLTQFSFVWEAETRGAGWYSVHALLRRILRERGEARLREADGALEAIYRERAEEGDTLALAEAIYHAYQQEPERGLKEWMAAFEEATNQSRYALCEALRAVGAELQPEDPWWRAEVAQREGAYLLLVRSRYAEADEALQVSVAAYDEALSRTPDDIATHNNKGNALLYRANLLAQLSRYEEAEQAYADAVAAYDEALSRAPDNVMAHNNKGVALQLRANLLTTLSRYEEAEQAYADAVDTFNEVLSRAPDYADAHANKGSTLQHRGDLLAELSRHEEAEQAYVDAVEALDEALSRSPDDIGIHNNKGVALQRRGDLLAELSRHEEAEQAYIDAVEALDETLSCAPDYADAHTNKGSTLQSRGALLAELSRYEEAELAYVDAVAAFDEALSRAPDDTYAHINRGNALRARGDLLAELSRHEEAEQAYADAVDTFNEVLSRAPDHTYAHSGKGVALRSRGDLLTTLSRYEEAEQAYVDAIAAFDEALSRSPDDIGIHNNKGVALRHRGDLLTELSRHEEAEQAYADAVDTFNEMLSRAPDHTYAHNNRGNALLYRANLLAQLSRYEEAEQAYADAVAAYDEALKRAPDNVMAHNNKALVLLQWGESMQSFVQDEVTRARWEAAQAQVEHTLALAPGQEQAEQLLASIRQQLHSLEAEPSQDG